MSANDPGSKSDHTSAEHHNDQVVHKVPAPVEKSSVPPQRRIHTEPDLVFPEIVESAARQSAS